MNRLPHRSREGVAESRAPGDRRAAVSRGLTDTPVAHAPNILLLGALITYVVIGAISVLFRDWRTLWAVGAGSVALSVPFLLLKTGRQRAGHVAVMLIVLASITAIASVGQGIRDIAVVAYPAVFIYVGLTTDRPMIRLCGALTFAALLWLALGERLGLFTTVPLFPDPFNLFYLSVLTLLMLIAALAVDLLSAALRRNAEEKLRLQEALVHAQKMESVGRLAGGVAHDFNNMLGVILGNTELALQQVRPDDPLHSGLEEAHEAALRSAALTRQLLVFARRQTVMPTVMDLNQAVGATLRMLQRMIGETIVLEWRPAADLWLTNVDPSQVDQVLASLCVNARDAISGSGTIRIETANCPVAGTDFPGHADAVPGEYVLLSVSDNGCGMDAATMSHLFEPFFTTKALGEGTGLGLATVYGAVKQNGGFITVRSQPGEGSTFAVYLPRHTGPAQPPRRHVQAPARGSETVLVVEDEPSILRLTTRMIERHGYRVRSAATAEEAIRVAKESPTEIHLLVTDVVMPGMNGQVLARNIRALHPRIKCLYMSGYAADTISRQDLADGEASFIQKPFSSSDLGRALREILDRT